MKTISDLSVTSMLQSVHISSAVLADLENASVAFGTSLLSCLEAEILRFTIRTSGNGGHLQFTTYPDVGKCPLLVLACW